MGLSYCFRDKRRFQSKIAKFSHPCVFCAPAEGVPLELGIGTWGQKTIMMGATGTTKKFDDVFSRLDIMHERDRQTDGRRATSKTALSVAR